MDKFTLIKQGNFLYNCVISSAVDDVFLIANNSANVTMFNCTVNNIEINTTATIEADHCSIVKDMAMTFGYVLLREGANLTCYNNTRIEGNC
ncbi:MAG: hypothetical protein ACTSRW_00030 [Candidatus Helarchaeota archaeon]